MSYYQPTEPYVWQPCTNSFYPIANQGIYGSLLKTYFLPNKAYPGPQSEDTLIVNGSTYFYFMGNEINNVTPGSTPAGNATSKQWSYGVVLGPTTI
jgi:hypothetical protein